MIAQSDFAVRRLTSELTVLYARKRIATKEPELDFAR